MDKQGSGWRNTPTSKMKGYHLTAQSIVHPLTSSLCISNQSAPCLGLASPANTSLGRSVQGAPLTTTTIMTREDVRAQLAKNPLVWIEDNSYSTFVMYSASLAISVDEDEGKNVLTGYDIELGKSNKWCRLEYYNKMFYSDVRQRIIETQGYQPSIDEVKKIAESHRLDLTCQILGITE